MPATETSDSLPIDDSDFERLLADVRRAASELPEIPGYRVIAHVGTGGFGTVYRARDLKLERDVALKVLHARVETGTKVEEQFLREARTLARVCHPNVVTLYGVVEHEGLRALSTEYIEGRSLEEICVEEGSLAPSRVIEIGIDLTRALAAVHAAGIIHRDVKTTNILVDGSGRVLLADFGLGVQRGLANPRANGEYVAGTPLFMAPEVLRGAAADARADIYALGVVLYRLLAGRVPYTGRRVEDLIEKIETGKLDPPTALRTDLEVRLWGVIENALSADPDARFETPGAMAAALTGILEIARGSPPTPRRRIAALAILGALSIAAGAAIWLSGETKGPFVEFQVRASIEPSRKKRVDSLRISLAVDSDVHVYVVGESKGKHYLVYPRTHDDAARTTSDLELSLDLNELEAALGEKKARLAILACHDPLPLLIDSIPRRGTSPETGKGAGPRLKPPVVLGLVRILGGAGWIEPREPQDPDSMEWVDELPSLEARASRGGIWAGKETL